MQQPDKGRIQLLVDALRSGEFLQGQAWLTSIYLRDDGGTEERHCCLGVACRIAVAHGVQVDVVEERVPDDHPERENGFVGFVTYDGTAAFLPTAVMEWYGFPSNNPHIAIHRSGSRFSAAMFNDDGNDFPKIADAFVRTFGLQEVNADAGEPETGAPAG